MRKRRSNERIAGEPPARSGEPAVPRADETAHTATVERVPDPALPEFGAEWDAAYEQHLFERALETVKERIDLKQFQIYDFYVLRAWRARQVAHTMEISVARVYLAKHRVERVLKQELARLKRADREC